MSIAMRFEGHSDDTFSVHDGSGSHSQDNAGSGRPMIFLIESPTGGAMYVWGQYSGPDWPKGSPACWMIGLQQFDEGEALPNWPMLWGTSDSGYSPLLVVTAPDDATVRAFPSGADVLERGRG